MLKLPSWDKIFGKSELQKVLEAHAAKIEILVAENDNLRAENKKLREDGRLTEAEWNVKKLLRVLEKTYPKGKITKR